MSRWNTEQSNIQTIALILPDGVSVRNFWFSRFPGTFTGQSILTLCAADELDNLRAPAKSVRIAGFEPLRKAVETRGQSVLKNARTFAHLHAHRTHNGLQSQRMMLRSRGSWKSRMALGIEVVLGTAASILGRIDLLDRAHEHLVRRHEATRAYEKLFTAQRPAFVFCGHQRASIAVSPVVAAKNLGIPTATFIFSWDNLPKARPLVQAEYYFVWSEYMAEEMCTYHPQVPRDRVKVVGTPQFEPYFDESRLVSRDRFLVDLGLDPGRPVVCFSGDDVTTSPNDPMYLADLAEAMRMLPEATRPQVLFRRCPVDSSGRYDGVLTQFPEIVSAAPLWKVPESGDWTSHSPTDEDTTLLVNTVRHSDLVVNVGSTMAVDFAICGKPAIYLAYDQEEGDGGWSTESIYSLPHFRLVHKTQPFYWARTRTDLAGLVTQALETPDELAAQRQELLARLVAHPLHEASHRIVAAILELCTPVESATPPNGA